MVELLKIDKSEMNTSAVNPVGLRGFGCNMRLTTNSCSNTVPLLKCYLMYSSGIQKSKYIMYLSCTYIVVIGP
jgi:hypothetical protein